MNKYPVQTLPHPLTYDFRLAEMPTVFVYNKSFYISFLNLCINIFLPNMQPIFLPNILRGFILLSYSTHRKVTSKLDKEAERLHT